MQKRNKITKDIVPEGFTLSLALIDFLPVVFFGAAMSLVGLLLKNYLFFFGAIVCFISGTIKVLWKIIIVNEKKNVWWMFLQMRIAMPLGFLMMMVAFIYICCTRDMSAFWDCFNNLSSIFFLIVGLLGMGTMIFFAFYLDSSDVSSNWIEQTCNAIAQFAIFIACLIAFFH